MIKNLFIVALAFLCIVLVRHSMQMEKEWTKLVEYYDTAERFIEECADDYNGPGNTIYCSDNGFEFVHVSAEVKKMLSE